jgi:hypothetical protein
MYSLLRAFDDGRWVVNWHYIFCWRNFIDAQLPLFGRQQHLRNVFDKNSSGFAAAKDIEAGAVMLKEVW